MCSKPCAVAVITACKKNFRSPPTKFLKNPCKFQNYEFFKGRHQCAVNPVLLLSSQHARKMTLVWQFWCDFSFQVDVRQRMNEKKTWSKTLGCTQCAKSKHRNMSKIQQLNHDSIELNQNKSEGWPPCDHAIVFCHRIASLLKVTF